MEQYVVLSDGSRFPRPALESDEQNGLAWKMRYREGSLSRSDQLSIANIIDAYGYLVMGMTNERRNKVCQEIKRETLRA